MRITFDITDKFAQALGVCKLSTNKEILRRLENIMSAIDDLRTQVLAVETNTASLATGLVALNDAMQELATDLANLPQNADVAAEAVRLAGSASAIGNAGTTLVGVAQAIRDAVPTPTPPADNPA
jgi:methyl-accepting chemotaxis protein